MKNKKLLKVFLILVFVFILFFPFKSVYEDGGTTTYSSLTYKVIIWNTLDGKTGTEVHIFPNNFHSLD